MDYKTFRRQFCEYLEKFAIRTYGKNAALHDPDGPKGITGEPDCVYIVKDTTKESSLAVGINIVEFYQRHTQHGTPLEELIADAMLWNESMPDEITKAIQQSTGGNVGDFMNMFLDFKNAREHIRYRLVCPGFTPGFGEHELQDTPTKPLLHKGLGLVKVYYLTFPIMDSCYSYIRNDLLKIWGVSLDEIDRIASENMEKYEPLSIKHIGHGTGNLKDYCVTTKNQFFGSACLAYDNIFRRIADEIGTENYFIVPDNAHVLFIFTNEHFKEEFERTAKELSLSLLERLKDGDDPEDMLSPLVYIVMNGKFQGSLLAKPKD